MRVLTYIILAFLILITIIFLLLFIFTKNTNKKSCQNYEMTINDLLQNYATENNLSIGAVSVVDNKVKYYSHSSSEKCIKIDSLTKFDTGSVGKLFTANLISLLDEKNIVDINERKSYLLKDDVKDLSCLYDITYYNLLSHTSGFPNMPEEISRKIEERTSDLEDYENPYKYICLEDMYSYLEHCSGKKSAGTKKIYSNFGYGLAGQLLEKEMGEDFRKIIENHLFTPLGMNNTSLYKSSEDVKDIVQGYTPHNQRAEIWIDEVFFAAGAYITTLEDMSKYLMYVLNESQDMNYEENKNCFPFLGWQVDKEFSFIKPYKHFWHNGSTGGFTTYIFFEPKKKIAFAMFANKQIESKWFDSFTYLGEKIHTRIYEYNKR